MCPNATPRRYTTRSIGADKIDQDAARVAGFLQGHGFEAYLVGGCVRDLLLGRTPKDFDMATSAHPRQVRRLFRNCMVIGRRFKLAHVMFGRKVIEVSTFRAIPVGTVERQPSSPPARWPAADGAANDLLITDDNVFGTAEDDARRRDFPINALFYDCATGHIIDYVGGVEDLRRRTIRTIGDPWVRFREDPVRILRAVKFAARLDFKIAPDAWEAMVAIAPEIDRCARPRVLEEIVRLFTGGAARASFDLLLDSGALRVIAPEISAALDAYPDIVVGIRAHLDGMDKARRSGHAVEAALALACIFDPIARAGFPTDQPPSPQNMEAAVNAALAPLAARLHLSRRNAWLARRIANICERLHTVPTGGRAMHLMNGEEFGDALAFLWIKAMATGEGWPAYRRWARLSSEHTPSARPLPAPAGPEAEPQDTPSSRGRRRRRPRRQPSAPPTSS